MMGRDKATNTDLSSKRKEKRTKFSWLARFLGRRPNRSQLVKQGILQDDGGGGGGGGGGSGRYFGVLLETVYADDSRLIEDVPVPVYYCSSMIRNFLDLEGIFRVSGTFSEMNRLTQAFEAGETPDLSKVDNKHSVSGLLEKFFRELPQPITTWKLYDEFMEAANENFTVEQRVACLNEKVAKLPPCNAKLLAHFLGLMRRIARFQHINKMGEKNLGVVFGSIILGPENLLLSLGDKKKLQNQSVVVCELITHCFQLFPDLKNSFTDEELADMLGGGGGGGSSSASNPGSPIPIANEESGSEYESSEASERSAGSTSARAVSQQFGHNSARQQPSSARRTTGYSSASSSYIDESLLDQSCDWPTDEKADSPPPEYADPPGF